MSRLRARLGPEEARRVRAEGRELSVTSAINDALQALGLDELVFPG